MLIRMIRMAGICLVLAASLLISSGTSTFFYSSDARGKILTARALPELLVKGQREIFEVEVKNLGNDTDFLIEVHRDSRLIATYNFNIKASGSKNVTFTSSIPPFAGEFKYTYTLYSGMLGDKKTLLEKITRIRRVY